ncbi:MAG: hypothetical protein E6K92_09950 [Thaumarchaeota archaeon]|nr:MAG: hypothetical protein E6K92_09950 [Nitrososphaerota archaeon]
MSVEQLSMKLRQKISYLGLKSAKFQFAIVKEEEVWKIFAIRVVLENIQEYGKTLQNKLDHPSKLKVPGITWI